MEALLTMITGAWPWMAGGAAIVVLWLLDRWGTFRRGVSAEAERRAGQDAKDYRDTRRRMDDAAGNASDDDGALRDWLRERGNQPDRRL